MDHAHAGFTIAELMGGLASLVLIVPSIASCTRPPSDFRSLSLRENLAEIRVAVERYHTDHGHYPPYLIGGDSAGWEEWHRRHDEPNPDPSRPQNAWVLDPLIDEGYLESYPQNPYVDNGNSIIAQTGPADPPYIGFRPGDGDPRFGFDGTVMASGVSDPVFFRAWEDLPEASLVETYRTLRTSVGDDPAVKGFGSPEAADGLCYEMGGRRSPPEAQAEYRTIYTHWPGNFAYRATSERWAEFQATGFRPPFASMPTPPQHYLLAAFGAFNHEGFDLIRHEATDPAGRVLGYRLPAGAPAEWSQVTLGRVPNVIVSDVGGLPEFFGGGDANTGPYYPYVAELSAPELIYGAPDGHPDAILLYYRDDRPEAIDSEE